MARIIDCPCGRMGRGEEEKESFRPARKHVDEDRPELTRSGAVLRARVAPDARDA